MKPVNSHKSAASLIIATLLLGVFAVQSSEAASSTPPVTPAACALEDTLNALLQIKDSDLQGKERDTKELEARKNVLRETMRCSVIESDALKSTLASFDLKNEEKDQLLQTKFLGDLEAAKFYFLSASSSIESINTLDGIKRQAEEMLGWRSMFYLPAIQKMSEFVLVTETRQATSIAKTRYDKIFATLSAFRLTESPDIKKLLSDSDTLIRESDELNTRAHEIILNTDYVFETSTLSSATSSDDEAIRLPFNFGSSTAMSAASSSATSTASSTTTTEGTQILSLVKDSLGKIQSTYNNYLNLSKLVKKLIGF